MRCALYGIAENLPALFYGFAGLCLKHTLALQINLKLYGLIVEIQRHLQIHKQSGNTIIFLTDQF